MTITTHSGYLKDNYHVTRIKQKCVKANCGRKRFKVFNDRPFHQASILAFFPHSHSISRMQCLVNEVATDQHGHADNDFPESKFQSPMTPPASNNTDCFENKVSPHMFPATEQKSDDVLGQLGLSKHSNTAPSGCPDPKHVSDKFSQSVSFSGSKSILESKRATSTSATSRQGVPAYIEQYPKSPCAAKFIVPCTPPHISHNIECRTPPSLNHQCRIANSNHRHCSHEETKEENNVMYFDAGNAIVASKGQNNLKFPHLCSKGKSFDRSSKYPTVKKKFKQLYIDLGQRDFAHHTVCPLCGMLYVHGLEDDAKQHSMICNQYQRGVSVILPKKNEKSVCLRWTDVNKSTVKTNEVQATHFILKVS